MSKEYIASVRRLPVYIMIDCSCSMSGDAIEAVIQGLKNLTQKLINDPYTVDIVWVSIIVFDSVPRQLVPLVPVTDCKAVSLRLGGCSNLGRALGFLKDRIAAEVNKQTQDRKGDWKPLVFLMSDGWATDDWAAFAKENGERMNLIACGVGSNSAIENLKKLSDKVVHMRDMSRETFDQFIDFLSTTMSTASQRSEGRSDRIVLEQKYDKIILY